MALTLFPRHLHVYGGRNSHEFVKKNRNGDIPYFVQNEWYASSGEFVLIFFARESIVSVSPFLQLQWQGKMAARFFLHADQLVQVVLSGTPFLRSVQYDRMFIGCVHYGNLLHVYTNANLRERFLGYIIRQFFHH